MLGDIGREQVDAIVTAANESLLGGGGYGEPDVLASCYRRSLAVAEELSARTVAFPAIATGRHEFPPELAAGIAVSTIRSTPTRVETVRLVAFDQATHDPLRAALT